MFCYLSKTKPKEIKAPLARLSLKTFCAFKIIKEIKLFQCGVWIILSDIIKKLKASELIVVEGTLYPLLTRLKNSELLTYRWEESPSGPPRKYYSLTKMGKTFLEELDGTWNELNSAVNQITQKAS